MFLSGYRTSGDVHIGSTVILIAVARNYSRTCRGFEISSSHFEITAVYYNDPITYGQNRSTSIGIINQGKLPTINSNARNGLEHEVVSMQVENNIRILSQRQTVGQGHVSTQCDESVLC